MYLEDVDEDHKTIVNRLKSEIKDLQENQKEELESLLKESEDLQSIHETEKSQLTQKFQEIVQGLKGRVEEELKLKMVERSSLKDDELIKIKNVCKRFQYITSPIIAYVSFPELLFSSLLSNYLLPSHLISNPPSYLSPIPLTIPSPPFPFISPRVIWQISSNKKRCSKKSIL